MGFPSGFTQRYVEENPAAPASVRVMLVSVHSAGRRACPKPISIALQRRFSFGRKNLLTAVFFPPRWSLAHSDPPRWI